MNRALGMTQTQTQINDPNRPLHGGFTGGQIAPITPPDAQVAQLVEQGTENPRVGGSSPPLATTESLCNRRGFRRFGLAGQGGQSGP